MKIPLLSPLAAKRYSHYLHSRFGIPESVMKDWVWAQHKENVFVFASGVQNFLHSDANIFSAGIQAFADGKSFQPASHFITLIGAHICQNIIEIPSSKLELFFSGKKIDRSDIHSLRVLSEGWVAVSLNGTVIGSASLTRNHLIPNLPGESHAPQNE